MDLADVTHLAIRKQVLVSFITTGEPHKNYPDPRLLLRSLHGYIETAALGKKEPLPYI